MDGYPHKRDIEALCTDFEEERLYMLAAMDDLKRAATRIHDRAALLAEMEHTGLING